MTGPLAAVSPLARAIRFGRVIKAMRKEHKWSQDDLVRKAGFSRPTLSRLENPAADTSRRSDVRHLRAALIACGVKDGSPQHQELMSLAWAATKNGWWDDCREMGPAQQLVANVECGAVKICEYHPFLVPGLAQTAAYARYRANVAAGEGVDPDAVVEGRLRRQRQMVGSGSTYRIILEEMALRRLAAPPDVMVEQLHHLVDLGSSPNVSIRVLPVDARLEVGYAPTSPYSLYVYPEQDDPMIVLLDRAAKTQPPIDDDHEVDVYVRLFRRLSDAALSDVDSAELMKEAAKVLTAGV